MTCVVKFLDADAQGSALWAGGFWINGFLRTHELLAATRRLAKCNIASSQFDLRLARLVARSGIDVYRSAPSIGVKRCRYYIRRRDRDAALQLLALADRLGLEKAEAMASAPYTIRNPAGRGT